MSSKKKVHFVLQGKGGVGKSLIASLVAQHYRVGVLPVRCLDTDPVNATFASYASLGAERVELMRPGDKGSQLDEREFDKMMEMLLGSDCSFVVDNGASSFIPLANYLLQNDAFDMLQAAGKEVIVHTVVTGSQSMMDTIGGLDSLATQLPANVPLMVWLNEFFGPIEADGKQFEAMRVYQTHRHRITGLIRIPQLNPATFGKDMQVMLEHKLTFEEAVESTLFGIMARQRLRTVWKGLHEQMIAAPIS